MNSVFLYIHNSVYICRNHVLKKIKMKVRFLFLLFLPVIFACNTITKKASDDQDNQLKIISTPEDEEILKTFIDLFSGQEDASTSDIMIKAGTFLLNTPYVEHTLEYEPELLIINLRELDCTTFVENCLALTRTLKAKKHDFEQFAKELMNIRYRDGKIDGYASRLHYFSDWIFVNTKKNLVSDVAKEIAETPLILKINYMSVHPESYRQMHDSTLISVIAEQEREISARKMYYIPKTKLAEIEDKLIDGDIIAITTETEGLDVLHTALLIRKNGIIHILHASSVAGKVIIAEETLENYLMNNKRATGIMVARPL